jgi:hypothetical protein
MKFFTFLIILSASLYSCDPWPTRDRQIPLQQLGNETVKVVDTISNGSVDKIIEE